MRNLSKWFLLFALLLLFGSVTSVVATSPGQRADEPDEALVPIGTAYLNTKQGAFVKVGGSLASLHADYQAYLATTQSLSTASPFQTDDPLPRLIQDAAGDFVLVEAVASGNTDELWADLQAIGARKLVIWGAMVSAEVPIAAIDDLAALSSLNFARPAAATTHVGLTDSQGDAAMRSDVVRTTYPISGSGIMVGTLSDSYDSLGGASTDVTSGDLPTGVLVISDASGTDEGRGMMQLIHDVVPGSSQAFHTAFNGQAGFASGILALASAGADVIVDDVIYFAEPMFQDGIIAQAVDTVVASGVSYFSSAGNSSRRSYESAFVDSGQTGPISGGPLHDFDPGAGVDTLQQFIIPGRTTVFISFQWDEPYASASGGGGSTSDVDIFLADSSGASLGVGGFDANIGGNPIEVFGFQNRRGVAGTGNFAIELISGTMPSTIKYVYFGPLTIQEYDTTSSTVYGHTNAAGAEAVGAAAYFDTPVFGTSPPVLESFSSAGPTTIFFDLTDTPIVDVRPKPEIVAPDGTNTTFFGSPDFEGDGFPNFFGTSAAAPHAAAVAALLREFDPGITVSEVYTALESTAVDMLSAGFDDDSGFGLIQADAAIASIPADFSDLAVSYGVAWHISDTLRLGSAWTADVTFTAGQDDANDDGVVRDLSRVWTPGSSNGLIDVTVAGCSAPPCALSAWIDWNSSGAFGDSAGEQVLSDMSISNGTTTGITITTPSTVPCFGGTCNARFRLMSTTGTGVTGAAADGEVSDFAWNFTPTAITLRSAEAGRQAVAPFIPVLTLVVLMGVLSSALYRWGRRLPN
jgi:hypothetical protein